MNAQEQEAQAGQDITHALEVLRLLENQDNSKHQHRHGVGGQVHLQTKAGYQPGARGGAQVGAENNPDGGRQLQQTRA